MFGATADATLRGLERTASQPTSHPGVWSRLAAGDRTELAERAGHARPSMSLDVYSHVMPLDEVPADSLEALLDERG